VTTYLHTHQRTHPKVHSPLPACSPLTFLRSLGDTLLTDTFRNNAFTTAYIGGREGGTSNQMVKSCSSTKSATTAMPLVSFQFVPPMTIGSTAYTLKSTAFSRNVPTAWTWENLCTAPRMKHGRMQSNESHTMYGHCQFRRPHRHRLNYNH
jgi:hypothetical protein